MDSALITVPSDPIVRLTDPERDAYYKFVNSGRPKLSADLASRLYVMYLNGKSCSEIQRTHSELSFGSIVFAKVEWEWDQQRDTHMERLMTQASDRAARTQIEAVDFLFDVFDVTHAVNRKAYEEYRRTGNKDCLTGALTADNVKQYRDLVSALLMLMGKPTQVYETKGEHKHQHVHARVEEPLEATEGNFLAQAAAQIRLQQDNEKKARDLASVARVDKKGKSKAQ